MEGPARAQDEDNLQALLGSSSFGTLRFAAVVIWFVWNQLKQIGDFPGNPARPAGGHVDEYPIGFPLGEDLLIRSANDFVSAQRPHFSEIGDPGQDGDDLAGKRRAEIFNPVHPCDPRRADRLRHPRAARGGGMLNGRILHPLHVRDIVHVAVSIYRLRGHHDFNAINRLHACCVQCSDFVGRPML